MSYTVIIDRKEAKKILKELERKFAMECEGNCDVCEYRRSGDCYRIDREPVEYCSLGRAIENWRDRASGRAVGSRRSEKQ